MPWISAVRVIHGRRHRRGRMLWVRPGKSSGRPPATRRSTERSRAGRGPTGERTVVAVREAATARCRVVAVALPEQAVDVRRALHLAGLDPGPATAHVTTHRPPATLLALLRPHVLVVAEEHLRAGPLPLPEAQRGQRARVVVLPTPSPGAGGLDVEAVAAAISAAATLAALQRWGLGYLGAARAAGLGAPPPAEPADGELLLARLRLALRAAPAVVAEQVGEAARLARGGAARHGLPVAEQQAVQEAAALVATATVAAPELHPSAHLARAGALLATGELVPVVAALGELALHEVSLGELTACEEAATGARRPDAPGTCSLEHLPVHAAIVLSAVRTVRAARTGAGYDPAGRPDPPALPHLLDTLA